MKHNSATQPFFGLPQSDDFQQRCSECRIEPDQIEYALLFGTRIHCGGGAQARVVRRKNLPANVDARQAWRYHGVTVILAAGGDLVTAYKSEEAYRNLKRKFVS